MYAYTTYNYVIMKPRGAMYTEYRPVRQTKMPTNVHYVPIHQTSNIPRIQYM